MNKSQITVTLEESQINQLQKTADKYYEGNISQALRMILREKFEK